VIAVVLHEGRALLVRRANPPDAGLWGFPGGKIEFGETVMDAAIRELREETGVTGEAQDILTTLDILVPSGDGGIRQHYILIAVRCRWLSGNPVAADDALEGALVSPCRSRSCNAAHERGCGRHCPASGGDESKGASRLSSATAEKSPAFKAGQ
jgi:8-oxo-dGTP diphosphatase